MRPPFSKAETAIVLTKTKETNTQNATSSPIPARLHLIKFRTPSSPKRRAAKSHAPSASAQSAAAADGEAEGGGEAADVVALTAEEADIVYKLMNKNDSQSIYLW